MKKINFRRVSEILSEREMKMVVGGNGCPPGCVNNGAGCVNVEDGNACGGSGNYSLKCYNDVHSCWVNACPSSRTDAEAMCTNIPECGGTFGSFISCAG